MRQRDILFLLASICVVIFAWIAFTILHNSLTSTITPATTEAIAPIQPNFDTATLKKMKTRIVVNPAFTISVTPTITLSPAPTPTTLPFNNVASQSAQTASQGGTLK